MAKCLSIPIHCLEAIRSLPSNEEIADVFCYISDLLTEKIPDRKLSIHLELIAKMISEEIGRVSKFSEEKSKQMSEYGKMGGRPRKQHEISEEKKPSFSDEKPSFTEKKRNIIEENIREENRKEEKVTEEKKTEENNLVEVEAKNPPLKCVKQAEILKKAQEVGDFLNAERGRKQVKYVDSSLKNVVWVLKNGFTIEDCKAVLRWMLYGKNSYYRDNDYVDLNTPFRQEKFQRNLQNAIAEGFEPAGSDGVQSDGKYPVDDDLVEGVDFFWDIERTLPDEEKIKATRFPEYYKSVPKCRVSMHDFCELPDKNRRYFDGRLDNSEKMSKIEEN